MLERPMSETRAPALSPADMAPTTSRPKFNSEGPERHRQWQTGGDIGSAENPAIMINKTAGDPYTGEPKVADASRGPLTVDVQPTDSPFAGNFNKPINVPEDQRRQTEQRVGAASQGSRPDRRDNPSEEDERRITRENNDRLSRLTPDQFDRVTRESMQNGRDRGQQSQSDLSRVIDGVAGVNLPSNEISNNTAAPTTEEPGRLNPAQRWLSGRVREANRSGRERRSRKETGAPSYSTAPHEGSRARPDDGVGDLPPGPKISEVGEAVVGAGVSGGEEQDIRERRLALARKLQQRLGADLGTIGTEPVDTSTRFGSGAEGAFYPEGDPRRYERPERRGVSDEALKGPETNAADRARRLIEAGSSFVKGLGERARKVAESIPRSRLKLDKNAGMALLALAGVALVLLSQGERKASAPSDPAKMPSPEYARMPDYKPVLGPEPVLGPDTPPPAPMGEQDPQGGVTTPERSQNPNVEPIKFPDNVTNRSLDGLVRKRIVELDPEFQQWLKDTGTNSADVSTDNPQFQAALLRTTVAMGGDAEFNAVVRRETEKQRREIQSLAPGRIIFDRQDDNKIVTSEFDAPKITQERIDKDREEIRQERQGVARLAVDYIRSIIDTSKDPAATQLLQELESGSAQMGLVYSQGEIGSYVYLTYAIGDQDNPIARYTEEGEPGKMTQSVVYKKDESGQLQSVSIKGATGISEEEQRNRLKTDFQGIDVGKFEPSVGMDEQGGFGHALFGRWTNPNNGETYMVGIDGVGRVSVAEQP